MKYRANVGGGIVEAQKVKDYRFDTKTFEQYIVLEDGERRPQPMLHGMKPMIGDWYVETSTGTTRLRDGSQYEERSAAAIIKTVDFALVYTPVPESGEEEPTFKKDVNEVTQDNQIEWTNFGKVTAPEEPYEVVVMPDQVGPMQEIINADDIVTEESGATLTPEMLALGVIAQDIAAQEISDNEIREADKAEARIEDGE